MRRSATCAQAPFCFEVCHFTIVTPAKIIIIALNSRRPNGSRKNSQPSPIATTALKYGYTDTIATGKRSIEKINALYRTLEPITAHQRLKTDHPERRNRGEKPCESAGNDLFRVDNARVPDAENHHAAEARYAEFPPAWQMRAHNACGG